MKELLLKDNFHQIFKEKLKVDENTVLDTYDNSDKKEALENNIFLFLKKFDNNHLTHLLLATQVVNDEMNFAFAYWIPDNLINPEVTLLGLLEVFANKFGCKVKIAETEGYFIRKTRKLIQGKLESPNQVLEILGSVHIPCESYLFYKENIGYNLNWIDCFYCFAINNNKYLTWLYKIDMVTIKIKSEWYEYLSEIRDVLDPFGKTGLTILSGKKEEGMVSHKEKKNDNKSDIDLVIHKTYINQFSRINALVSELNNNEKIVVIPRFENDKCIFCNSIDTSKEHIFAAWMKNYFEEKIFRSTLHTKLPEENLLNSLQSGLTKGAESSYGYTSHHVCINCNNTWLSQLEETVKNILVVKDEQLKTKIYQLDLNHKSANQLARWIIIKAILLSIKAKLTPSLPQNCLQMLKKGDIANGFLVEIAECESTDLNFIVNKGVSAMGIPLKLKRMDKTAANEIALDFFMVTIQIGHFLFRISYFDESRGLKRVSWIKRTTPLFPYNYNLKYSEIKQEEDKWNQIEDSIKLHIFNLGLMLTDE